MRLGLVLLCLVLAAPSPVQSNTDATYQLPSQVLADIVQAPLPPHQSLSPSQEWLLLMHRPSMPGIAELAEEELRLAGLRIKPRTNGPSRIRTYSGLSFLRLADLEQRTVTGLPEDARIGFVSWSPDSSRVAFTLTVEDGIELWVAEVASGTARRLTEVRLNLTAYEGPAWLPDSRHLVCLAIPDGRGAPPAEQTVPTGPVTQECHGQAAPAPTFQDLLQDAHDEALFEHYFTAQMIRVGLDGTVTSVGEPGIFWDFDPSPDGRFVLVEILHRPYSYLVTASRFPRRIEIWDLAGTLVRQVADNPLQEQVPITFGSVPTGPRSAEWRADAPATLCWAEALDGGDAGAEAELRDRLFLLSAPFDGEPQTLVDLELRYDDVSWGDGELALVGSWWWKTRTQRAWRLRPDRPSAAPELIWDRSFEDRYSDPGSPVKVSNASGRRVIMRASEGDSIFLVGDGASPEGDRPFLDRFDLEQRTGTRLFRSEAPHFEQPLLPLDAEGHRVITSRESVEEPPNLFERDLGTGSLRQLTFNPHPTPQLLGVTKELIHYQRQDGVELTGTLYLPKGFSPSTDDPLPMVMWAYPEEFKSADAAGQVQDSPYRFDRFGWWSPLLWLTQGYAVLDDPSMPVVGEGDEEPNDSFVKQLVGNAQAAIDEVVRRGVADRRRIAVGGHSYGAFMTANLLAHSDLFAAGIARSGAYNRTLTPFGFQAEERTLWQATPVYVAMSPFMHAEDVDEPILLIHGAADNNPGTFPMQSERFYNALKGLGGTARLVMLPHESHGYRARESVLHMLWETEQWLNTYVKNRPPDAETGTAEGETTAVATSN